KALIVADGAVDDDDVLFGQIGMMNRGDARVLLAGHGLSARRSRVVRDHECAACGTGGHPGLHVHVAELRDPALWHLLGEAPQLLGRGVQVDGSRLDQQWILLRSLDDRRPGTEPRAWAGARFYP